MDFVDQQRPDGLPEALNYTFKCRDYDVKLGKMRKWNEERAFGKDYMARQLSIFESPASSKPSSPVGEH